MTEYILQRGDHLTFEHGYCLMELVAHLAGEEHSDKPKCACPVLSAFGRRLNDAFWHNDTRTEHLVPAAPLLVNTRASDEMMKKRAFVFADLAVRRWLPICIRKTDDSAAGERLSKKLDGLNPIQDRRSADDAHNVIMEDNLHRLLPFSAFMCIRDTTRRSGDMLASVGRDAASTATLAGCVEDAAMCFIAILKGEDPWGIPLPDRVEKAECASFI